MNEPLSMPEKKSLSVAILCGGQSSEHEVSLESAKNVIQAIDKKRHRIQVIHITRDGLWRLLDDPDAILSNPSMQPLAHFVSSKPLVLHLGEKNPFVLAQNSTDCIPVDVIFPVLHGTHGEDGTLQGLLELLQIPYVGSGHLSSAVCMDKDFTKQLLYATGVPMAPWRVVHRSEKPGLSYAEIIKTFSLPLFIKPANTGSSVGVSKVTHETEFKAALDLAFQYDDKLIIEQGISGQEVECAVLGNQEPEASLPGEIISHHSFYSYEAKYLDPDGAELMIPARLPLSVQKEIQTLAKKAFKILGCSGMARMDFFVDQNHQIFLNEANTIPGFTQISMYPKMWMASGLSYVQLIDRLIELALDRFAQRVGLSRNR